MTGRLDEDKRQIAAQLGHDYPTWVILRVITPASTGAFPTFTPSPGTGAAAAPRQLTMQMQDTDYASAAAAARARTTKATTMNSRFDPAVPHAARVYNFWLGGKDHFEADRMAGEQVRKLRPEIVAGVRANRRFLSRVVRYLVVQCGIRQFLDIGTGLPAPDNTHEVAQQIAPECRIVYVDNDPLVLTHARALLTSSNEGSCDYLQADLRDTDAILREAARTLDFTRPVAVFLLAVLHLVPDTEDRPGSSRP